MKNPNWHLLLMRILWVAVFWSYGLTVQAMTEEYDPTKGPGAKRYGINWNPSGTKAFDPAACKHKEAGYEGHIYWAAGKQVFRFRYYPALPIFSRTDKDVGVVSRAARKDIPAPPNSTEPEGCYLNPLRAGAVPYMAQFAVDMFERLWEQKFQESTLHPVGFHAIPSGHRSINGRGQFDQGTSCWVRPSGMEECRVKVAYKLVGYLSPRVYRIDKSLLPEYPNSMDVYCSSSASTSVQMIDNKCNVTMFGSVILNIGLRIDYSFNKKDDPEVDLNIDYLKALMTYLIKAQVSNYQWSVTK